MNAAMPRISGMNWMLATLEKKSPTALPKDSMLSPSDASGRPGITAVSLVASARGEDGVRRDLRRVDHRHVAAPRQPEVARLGDRAARTLGLAREQQLVLVAPGHGDGRGDGLAAGE